jgi:hypothetical protein
MKDRLSDLLLSFLITTRIKRMEFIVASVPSTEECCSPNMLQISVDYKWFWQKKSSMGCPQ